MLTYEELVNERNQSIVVSNRLIQNSYFELNMIPLKILLYCISKIQKDDEPNKIYRISVRDLCQVCNMKIKGTNAYKGRNGIVYRTMRDLRGKHLDLFDEQGRAFNTGWFAKVKMENDNDTVYYTFDSDLMPYLFHLTNEIGGFTITVMEIICALETPQGIRLYLFLRSIASLRRTQRIDLDTIRERTGNVGLYEDYSGLRKRILTPAIEDINKYSDIEVEYNVHKEGKRVVALDFTITTRKQMSAEETEQRRHNRNMTLYGRKNPNRQYRIEKRATRRYRIGNKPPTP